MRARRRLQALVLVGALVATACGGDDEGDEPNEPVASSDADGEMSDDGPRTVAVDVDGEIAGSNVAILGYTPQAITVRQGDTVAFEFQPGDPHTVSFGSLIDEAMGMAASGGDPSEAFGNVPQAFSDQGQIVATGALPCYSADAPPADGTPCEQVDQPAFTGADALHSSGLLEPGNTWSLTVAADAAAGTYNYLCLLHGADMSGTVTVVAADGDGQTAADVDAARDAAKAELASAAGPFLEAQATGVHLGFEGVFPEGGVQVLAGGFLPEPAPVDVIQFGPAEATVAAGESVTFNMVGFHTISFNVTQDATPFVVPGEDGLPSVNVIAATPQGGANGAPPPPDGGGEPPAEDAPPMVLPIDGGTFDGSGFFSSGVLPSFPPVLMAYSVTFATPGTYPYACLVHPNMEGTITVT